MERTLGFYYAQMLAVTATVAAFRMNGIQAACSVAPVVVDGAEGTILAVSVDELMRALVQRLAATHGGIMVADLAERLPAPVTPEPSASGLNSVRH